MLRRRSPETAGEWIAFIIAIAAATAVDALLKKNFPNMALRLRRGLSSIATLIILLLYFFVIRK
ncbi:MAG: hypothetical protein ACI4J0_04835 [Huintestinicola sp.]|uniref:hypothetical protein n=1 Tax=Huintestinicola sp. TaxID=2981661 RepID=UPI003F05C9A8